MSRTTASGVPIRGRPDDADLGQAPVIDKDLTAPPGAPSLGDRYIVASVASGAWTGQEDDIAQWAGSAWVFETPIIGVWLYVEDEKEYYSWNGTAWVQESFGPHAATHQDGGVDEISVAALSGLLADAQTPLAHASSHAGTGSDLLPPHSQVLFVGKHGNDANDGKHTDRPFLTFSAAIAAASADTPSASNRYVIVCQDAGIYDETPALASYISLHAPDATISRLWLYDQCYVTIGRIVATAAAVWGIGSGTAYLRARYIETPGAAGGSDGITVVTGQTLHLILDVDEISVSSIGDGIVVDGGSVTGRVGRIKVEDGNAIWATIASVTINLTVGEIEITGTGMGVNSGSNGNVQVTVGRIFDAGAGKALLVTTKARVSVGSISCGNAYTVGGSGELYLFVNEISGTKTVTAGGLAWVNGEVRNALATTDATVTTIATIPIPDDTAVWIETNIQNRRTDVAGRGKWKRGALIYREAAGAATMEGGVWTPLTIKSAIPAVWDVDIIVSGNNALIQVTGAAAQSLNWTSRHTLEERG